jgi:hypothetical protein
VCVCVCACVGRQIIHIKTELKIKRGAYV